MSDRYVIMIEDITVSTSPTPSTTQSSNDCDVITSRNRDSSLCGLLNFKRKSNFCGKNLWIGYVYPLHICTYVTAYAVIVQCSYCTYVRNFQG